MQYKINIQQGDVRMGVWSGMWAPCGVLALLDAKALSNGFSGSGPQE